MMPDDASGRRGHQVPPATGPRVLMLGKEWFPGQVGGLNRMFRGLFESLPPAERLAVVVGSAAASQSGVFAASRYDAPMWRRMGAYARCGNKHARDVDVIDAHFALYAMPLTILGAARSLPWVVHFQGPWAAESVVHGDTSGWRYRVRRAIERRVYRRAGRILVLTSAFRQELVTRYALSPWNVDVVPPGVDLARFAVGSRDLARERFGLSDGAFVAVCVRRLVPRMGVEQLLDAWQAVVEDNMLPPGSRLLIAGDGVLREDLASRVDELGLGSSVGILGRLPDEDLVALYRAADVNVVPTVEHEGFGLVVLEAAACGTPSIVTDSGGLPEAVDGLDRSLVVPAADASALGIRIAAAADGELPKRVATRAYAERYSWGEMAARRREIYAAVVGREPDPRIRVVYLDHVAQLSGGELALLRLLPYMDEVNAHVVLFEDGPFAARLRQLGISVEILPLDPRVGDLRKEAVRPGRLSPRVIWSTVRFTLRLSRRLRQLRPDLVHTNSLKAGVIGSLAARLAGVPVVWHLRDRLSEDYLPRPAVGIVRWWARVFATRIIANSAHTAQTLAPSRLGWKGATVREVSVAPSPAAPIAATGLKPDRRTGPFTVGMVGRIAPWKGQDIFLRAFAQAFPDGDERAVIVGSAMFGEQDFAASVVALAEQLGIAERVEWRGFVEDVAGELASFDVLVHASRTPEPFGQVVIEGFAAGVPVVAADEGGPSELVRSGHDGLLCPAGDVDAYAETLVRLRSDARLRERLAAAGRERVADFSPGIVVDEVMTTYAAALGRKRARGPHDPL